MHPILEPVYLCRILTAETKQLFIPFFCPNFPFNLMQSEKVLFYGLIILECDEPEKTWASSSHLENLSFSGHLEKVL